MGRPNLDSMEEEEEVIRFSSRASPGRTGGKTVPAKAQAPAGAAAAAPGFVIHCKHLSNRQNFLRLYYDVLCNLLQEQQQQVRPTCRTGGADGGSC